MSLLTWLGELLGKGSSKSDTTTSASGSASLPSLPPLPTGSVSAVADAVTEAGRIVEQQTNLHNSAAMQQAKVATQDEQRLNKIESDVANEDINAMRSDVSE